MKPRYETRDDFYVMGVGKIFERGNTQEIGDLLWPRLIKRFDEIPNKLGKDGDFYIPAQKYAVFTHRGGVKDLSLTNQYIWGTWLPQSGYELAPASDLEVYPAAFRPDDHDSEIELWIPLISAPQVIGV